MSVARRFAKDEQGAISVDWVALTAGLSLMGVAVVYGIMTSVGGLSTSINSSLIASGEVLVDPGASPDQTTFTAFALTSPGDDGSNGPEENGSDGNDTDGNLAPDGSEDSGDTATAQTLCRSGVCYVDTNGDGFADQRTDGGNTFAESNGIPMTQLQDDGYTSDG